MTRGLRPIEWVVTGFAFSVLLLAFNNCGQGFAGNSNAFDSALGPTPPSPPSPPSPPAPPNPTPTPNPGQFPPNRGGTVDANCLNNSAYDACLFWKNPVVHKGSGFSPMLMRGANLDSIQTFGVVLPNRTNINKLQSPSINVTATSGTTPSLVNGQLRRRYVDDNGTSWVAQLMAYFWISHQENQMKSIAGNWFAANKNIQVDAFKATGTPAEIDSLADNAYFSSAGPKVVMGFVSIGNNVAHEMALSGEVYLHEMGHADLHFAGQGNSLYNDSNATYLCEDEITGDVALKNLSQLTSDDIILAVYCKTNQGCISGIHEGQADFHSALIFPEKAALGETMVNDFNGSMISMQVPRDPSKVGSWNAVDFYNKSASVFNSGAITVGGEIHGIGMTYMSALWKVYNDPTMTNKSCIAKIFSQQLTMLTASSRFPEARTALASAATALKSNASCGGVDYAPLIRNVFSSIGVP